MERDIEQLRSQPHWSYTALNTYLNICQLKFYYQYIENAERERTSSCFAFGRAFHAVLSERAIKGRDFSKAEAVSSFAFYLEHEIKAEENLIFKPGEDIGTLNTTAERMLSVVLDGWQDDHAVIAVAQSFAVDVPGLSKPLIGEFDLVVRDGNDPCIVDWKTASSRWAADKADKDLQATVFSYAYHKLHGEMPLFRFDVITKAKTPVLESHYTMRGQEGLDRFEWMAQQAEAAIQKGIFLPNETSFCCGECPYRNRCKNSHRKD